MHPLSSIASLDGPVSDEKKLISMLLERYLRLGSDGRPVRNTSTPVSVHFGLGLIKMELLEKENMLSMSTWTRYVSRTAHGRTYICSVIDI